MTETVTTQQPRPREPSQRQPRPGRAAPDPRSCQELVAVADAIAATMLAEISAHNESSGQYVDNSLSAHFSPEVLAHSPPLGQYALLGVRRRGKRRQDAHRQGGGLGGALVSGPGRLPSAVKQTSMEEGDACRAPWRVDLPVYEILRSTLPEFFGSLAAGMALTAAGWSAKKLRERRALRRSPRLTTPDSRQDAQG